MLLSRLSLATTLLFVSVSGFAACQTCPPCDSDPWRVSIAPYLWAVNMNGTAQVGHVRAHINQNFGDVLNHMNIGGMLWVNADKGKWGVFGNALYASVSGNNNYDLASVHAYNKLGIFSAGISYQIFQQCLCSPCSYITFDPYIGFRYTMNNTTVKLNALSNYFRASNNQNWTDPIIGLRMHYQMTNAWSLILAGDVGGVNVVNHSSYDLWGLIGYKPQTIMRNTNWYLGYRQLDQHYATGSGRNYYNWNMKLFGPVFGVSFTIC